jgi:hypothetical protein
VEHGQVQRVDGTHVVVAVVLAVRAHEVPDRFGHALEGQSHRHASREQHGKPGEVRLVGFGLFEAQLDVTVLRDEEVQQEEHPDLLRAHVNPRHVDCHASLRFAEECLEVGRLRLAADHEGPDQDCTC